MEALEKEDETLCLEVVRAAIDWGGVYYSRGVRKGNQQQVVQEGAQAHISASGLLFK